MKSEWKKITDKYHSDIKELQDKCSHDEVEDIDYYWAPGHFDGTNKVCKRCHKRLIKVS